MYYVVDMNWLCQRLKINGNIVNPLPPQAGTAVVVEVRLSGKWQSFPRVSKYGYR